MTAAPELTPSGAPRIQLRLIDIVDSLLEHLNDSEGEVTDAIEFLELQLEDKVQAYHVVMKQLDGEAKAFAELEKAYKARKLSRAKAVDALKERLETALNKAGFEAIKTKTVHAYFQESESIEIADEDAFAFSAEDRFVVTKHTPNRAEIKKAIDAGELVDGATVKTSRSLRFR